MSGRERSRNRTWSLDSDLDSRASQTVGSSSGGLEEDKEVASQAVLFFINGSRRGAVHLCSSIAEILRENQRTTPPCLPPLVPLHNLTPQRRQTAVLPCVKEYEKEDPGEKERRGKEGRRGDERVKKRGGEKRQEDNRLTLPSVEEDLGSQPLPIMPHSSHSDSNPRERVRRREKGNLSSEQGGQTSDRKHTLKAGPHYHTSQWTHEDVTAFMMSCFCGSLFFVIDIVVVCEQKRENVLRRSASCGPLRGAMEETKEEERWCLAPDCPDSSSTVQAAGGLDPRALTTRKKHRLCVNDRVVLERRRRGEERRRGAVRFIGPLENTESTDIYIGVELDTASGENEGSLHGNRYFRCKPNHGTFTTITGIRKLSRSSHSKSRSSKPPEEGDSSDSGPGSSAVAIGRSSQSVGSRNGLRRTWNQMDIRAQVHSEPGGPRDKTTVENPGLD
ncbi:uncharacterized protein LOC110530667 isoform X4 [Oncorhynchus mykiss]|uniref:uncharacterized protein LOC110530667 isoform X4 n=1 Tax=Oncorhynchus mykiss TaxID=8022 RepID=UPI001878CDBB|nr:uncharacterized protein LOC110530667 isoform X4 [Oncorhynchus mykiss]